MSIKDKELRDQDLWGEDHQEGGCLLPQQPLPPHNFQVIPSAQMGSETPSARVPRQADSGPSNQTLAGAHQRWLVSEGFLPPTELSPPRTEQRQRGGKGRGCQKRSGTGGEEVGAFRIKVTQELRTET